MELKTGHAGIALAAIAGLAAVGAVMATDKTNDPKLAVVSSFDQGSHTDTCTTGKKFYAYDAPQNSRNFGPNQRFDTAQQGADRLQQKVNCDRLYAPTLALFLRYGESLPQDKAQQVATALANNDTAWKQIVDAVYDDPEWGIAKYELLDEGPTDYDSLGMVLGADPSVQPTLTNFGQLPQLRQVLKLTLKNGQVRLLRVECDLQPSIKKFTSVPVVPFTPAPITSIPSTDIPTTWAPPPTTTTYVPSCTDVNGPNSPLCGYIPTCEEANGPQSPICGWTPPPTTTPPPTGNCVTDGTPCPKDPSVAPGQANGTGTGGFGKYGGDGNERHQVDGPASAPAVTPSATVAPTSKPVPTATQTQAPKVTVTSVAPTTAQPTVAPSTQPKKTGEVTVPSKGSASCGDSRFCEN